MEVKVKTKKKHPILKKVILTIFILMILAVLILAGIVAGIFFSDKFILTEDDLTITNMNGIIKDKNGDIAYIPQGFRVSLAEGTNEIRSGLVITDEIDENGNSTGNEFVWIPVNDFYGFMKYVV